MEPFHIASVLGDIGNIAQGIAALAAVVGLFFAGYQIRQGRQLERERLVGSYLERLNSGELFDSMAESRELLNIQDADQRKDRWNNFLTLGLRDQQRYFRVMNLFEELATLFNDGLVSERSVRRLIGRASVAYWNEVRWFVDRYRQEVGDADAFSEWQTMNDRLQPLRGGG